MSLISRLPTMTGQKAVWWQRLGNSETGAPIYADPVEISVRWEDRIEEFKTQSGETQVSSAVVYPDRDLSPKDQLRLGELTDLTSPIPEQWSLNQGVREVRAFQKFPNLRGSQFLRIVYI